MTKYIDADALIAQIRMNIVETAATERGATDPTYLAFLNSVLHLMTQEIEEAPAADVVPMKKTEDKRRINDE